MEGVKFKHRKHRRYTQIKSQKEKQEWGNSDTFFGVIRCLKSKWADNFLNYGEIKFSTPQSWIEYGKTYGDGRGDIFEGIIAYSSRADLLNTCRIEKQLRDIPDLVIDVFDNYVFFRREKSIQLPSLCFYQLKTSQFDIPEGFGTQHITGYVPGRYFSQFSDNMLPEEYMKLSAGERPSAYIVQDFNTLRKRITNYLIGIGLSEDEIIFSSVSAREFNDSIEYGYCELNSAPPNELFIKRTKFADQNELRIVINTDKEDIRKRLIEVPIRIGSMTDIAGKMKGYPYDGIRIEATAEIVNDKLDV